MKETGAFTSRAPFPGLPEAEPALVAASFKLMKPGDVLEIGGEIPKAGDAYILAVLKDHVQPDEKEFEQHLRTLFPAYNAYADSVPLLIPRFPGIASAVHVPNRVWLSHPSPEPARLCHLFRRGAGRVSR